MPFHHLRRRFEEAHRFFGLPPERAFHQGGREETYFCFCPLSSQGAGGAYRRVSSDFPYGIFLSFRKPQGHKLLLRGLPWVLERTEKRGQLYRYGRGRALLQAATRMGGISSHPEGDGRR